MFSTPSFLCVCVSLSLSNNKSMGHDNINPFLLKLALPYIVQPLTYIYNLSILNNVFPTILKIKKLSNSSAQNQ